ncbi:Hairy/enhancer-of-split with YRPW motif protein 2 [Rhizina undulata]
MELDTKTPPYKTSDKSSFAYVSARDRWPVILTQAIDDVFRTNAALPDDPERAKEGKKIIEELARLKYEMQHDRALTPLGDDGGDDIGEYNDELEKLGFPKWFDAPWLFAECYLYRRINISFTQTKAWKSHDVFAAQKSSTFKSSLSAVLELSSKYRSLLTAPHAPTPEKDLLLFTEILEICLWGNATDLSLLTNLSYEDIQKLQGSAARKAAEANILANDAPRVFSLLEDLRNKDPNGERRVDIVLDNSGFELFVDLILAGYLLSNNLATEIIFHPKSFPWFVSDVLPHDFADLLNALRDPVSFFGPLEPSQISDLNFVFNSWSEFHANGKLVLRPSRFWTTAASYWRLPAKPELWEDLKRSQLLVFKGDLNYRKLTGDAEWAPTTSFEEAIGPLGGESGVRVLALRTCKADVVVGLKKGVDEELRKGDAEGEGRKWAWSGKWAVVEFWDGKKRE